MSDILSATALEDAAKKVGEALRGGSISKGDDGLGALLRHLRALTAPADGEALGRLLGEAIDATMGASAIGAEDIMQKAAIRLHAIGHAAGALSREGEIAALREDLEGERRAYAVRAETEQTEIARLTAELTATRAERDRLKRREADIIDATDPADGGQWRADIVGAIQRLRREMAAARADGAREERERIEKIVRPCVYGAAHVERIRAPVKR